MEGEPRNCCRTEGRQHVFHSDDIYVPPVPYWHGHSGVRGGVQGPEGAECGKGDQEIALYKEIIVEGITRRGRCDRFDWLTRLRERIARLSR